MSGGPYPIIEIQPEWVLEPEAMGSKTKFWYREPDKAIDWLFKYPQANTGQHWAEKIAAEVAALLKINHARVELAVFQGEHGSATESFARDGRELFHGNQIMAGKLLGYDPNAKFRHSDHTFENILKALDAIFRDGNAARTAKKQMAGYFVLDAVIGNTDRHHENWGLLRKRAGENWQGFLSPSFDHASSLGRELRDERRTLLLEQKRAGTYAEKAPGAIYWNRDDKKGISPLELVRRATARDAELMKPALEKLTNVSENQLREVVERVPADCMSHPARQFALALMCYNLQELHKLT